MITPLLMSICPVSILRQLSSYYDLCKYFLWICVFIVLAWTPTCKLAGSYFRSMFNRIRNCWSIFQSGCFTFPTTVYENSSSSYVHQHLMLPVFLTFNIFMSMKWYLTVILKYISLLTNDVEHLFIDILAICISSLMEYPIICPFFTECLY